MSKLTAKMVKKQGAVVIYISGAFRHYVLKTKNGYKFLSMMDTVIIARVEARTFAELNKAFRGGLKIGSKV